MRLLQLKNLLKSTTPVVVDEKTTYNGVLKDVVSEKPVKWLKQQQVLLVH